MRVALLAWTFLSLAACVPGSSGQADLAVEAPPCSRPRSQPDFGYSVFFDAGSPALSARARASLDQLAAGWKRVGVRFVELHGNMDGEEARTARPSLGLERAKAVKRYLAAQGIEPDRIVAAGMGVSQPAVKSDLEEPQERRVEWFPVLKLSDQDRTAMA